MHTVLVLGGYGFFGRRICQMLAADIQIHLLIAGRDGAKAHALALELGLASHQGLTMDARSPQLAQRLAQRQVDTVIHTAGPFQGQDYAVAHAAILAGAHYIDLADGCEFVAGIDQLHALAQQRGVLVTSGASSLPALSSAVVDHYVDRFTRLDKIAHGIGSGAKAPGLATMQSIFGYCGKPFLRRQGGSWRTVYGWLDTQYYRFPPPVGRRWLGACHVPDLRLFVARYPSVHTVTFHAGFASAWGHLVVWALSLLVRAGWIPGMRPLAQPLHVVSGWLERVVSDKGAMFVSLEGTGTDGKPLRLTWHLIAAQHHGPYIPCGAAVALVKKLARGEPVPCGAMPCMGILSVHDYLRVLGDFDIEVRWA